MKPEVRELFERHIAEATKGLARFEQVKTFALLDNEFTVEGGELTPTLKVRRKIVNERYADRIAALYEGHGGPPP